MAKTPKMHPEPGSKEERLAEALRENLKRRKAQNRQRKGQANTAKPPENGAD